ncbi:hypothetical protein WJ59_17360 [Burkholderia gladioli]|uniref:hypothetical protein n=1 Tax=Burkholderia TaxID=32008 RepID=UPI0005100F7D|nr:MULTISPECIES: hypothetical protein [Burkholderia]KGE06466.1 hypothetical protein LA03_31745 [Burkholderia gladioli]KVM65411.1 hypothetical protein WJ59_17360 [Burkholderia gladioli]MBJ9673345.1 hypothetical protein [Burkholderia gladioli]MBU9382079.1 hypothetical protein [Burkholderia gladioli]MDN7460193.1 hypothetical protein [Burkholderia gladioli]
MTVQKHNVGISFTYEAGRTLKDSSIQWHYHEPGTPFPEVGDYVKVRTGHGEESFVVVERHFSYEAYGNVFRLVVDLPKKP